MQNTYRSLADNCRSFFLLARKRIADPKLAQLFLPPLLHFFLEKIFPAVDFVFLVEVRTRRLLVFLFSHLFLFDLLLLVEMFLLCLVANKIKGKSRISLRFMLCCFVKMFLSDGSDHWRSNIFSASQRPNAAQNIYIFSVYLFSRLISALCGYNITFFNEMAGRNGET